MFFVASKIFDCLTSPLIWIIASFLFGWLLRNEKLRRRFLFSSLLMLLFFTNPFIANEVLQWWEIPAVNGASIKDPYDVGIVLGGCMRYYNRETDRIVFGTAVDRLMQAIALYHDKKIKKILLSGGSGSVMYKDWREAAWLAEVLYKSCVPKQDVIIENESRNTYENAKYTATILTGGSYGKRFLLITSATHIRRSLMCFNKAGLIVEPFSVDERSGKGIYTPDKIIIPNAENIDNWDVLIHEWIGIVTYKMAGYI